MNTEIKLDWIDWVLILVDRSGSMDSIRVPTIEGLNGFLQQQRAQPKTSIQVLQFGTDGEGQLQLEPLFDSRLERPESTSIARGQYHPDGDTPLFIAVIRTIEQLERDVRPQDHALVVIQTDGGENASPPEYTLARVRRRIAEKIADGWVFAYLGVELDSWATGERMGVGMLNSMSYSPTAAGVRAAFKTTSERTDRWRAKQRMPGRKALVGQPFYPLQLPAPKA